MSCPCTALHWSFDCTEHGPIIKRSLETDKLWNAAVEWHETPPVRLKDVLKQIMQKHSAGVGYGG